MPGLGDTPIDTTAPKLREWGSQGRGRSLSITVHPKQTLEQKALHRDSVTFTAVRQLLRERFAGGAGIGTRVALAGVGALDHGMALYVNNIVERPRTLVC